MMKIVCDGPTLGGDFEDFAGGVSQVEEDFGWYERIAFEANTMVDLLGWRVAILGASFECAEDSAESEGGRNGFKFGIVIGGEPVVKIGRAEGEDAAGIDAGRDTGIRLAAWGKEWRGGASVVEERASLVRLAETLGHASWFERSSKNRCSVGMVREVVEGRKEILGSG